MITNKSIESLKGTWDYVDGDNIDGYLKELGISFVGRTMAKSLKPRLVITENNGKWTLCTETSLRRTTIEFTPGFEYEETTPDGRELKGIIQFENDKWIQKMCDKTGKESIITRWIDENDQQQIIMECGKSKVHRFFKRLQ